MFVPISRSRLTGTITINARLASELYLNSLQSEFFSNLVYSGCAGLRGVRIIFFKIVQY
jgi:hypothetical protein